MDKDIAASEEPAPPAKPRKQRSKAFRIFLYCLFGVCFTLAVALFSLSVWYNLTFNISFSDLLFTLLSPLGGTGGSMVSDILTACLPPVILLTVGYVVAAVLLWPQTRRRIVIKRIGAILCVVALLASAVYGLFAFRIPEYLKTIGETTLLYDTEYVDPSTVSITDRDNNAKNLIYIYLESMETTYASLAEGGKQPEINYIPHMTALAKEHVSFSDDDKLGGFKSITGTSWTMGALMGTTSGVPFSLAVFGKNSQNSQGQSGSFVNGLTTLGDILEKKGYTQEFLCGSDSTFAGTKTYLTIHGNYRVFDYFTAIEEGYIAEDYEVWWGFEDALVFDIAKDEIIKLAAGDQPFNFTMATMDTHSVGGYRCRLCRKEHDTRTANVVACQDRQLYDFIEWCKQQDFYENTTIVITGDHPRMDKYLIPDGLDAYNRPVYNCIINAATKPLSATTQRTFTALDMFPTTLAAMGFEIEGDRLGLGVNLFSSLPTLCEKYGDGPAGYDYLNEEFGKWSDYYVYHFVKDLS